MPGARIGTPRLTARNVTSHCEPAVAAFHPSANRTTDAGRTAGHDYLARVAARLATGRPEVSEAAATGQFTAIGKSAKIPFEQVLAELEAIIQPVLYATGMRDAMIPALGAYVATQHLANATLVIYSDAGHAFLFQHAKDFATQVTHFLAA